MMSYNIQRMPSGLIAANLVSRPRDKETTGSGDENEVRKTKAEVQGNFPNKSSVTTYLSTRCGRYSLFLKNT